MSDSLSAQIDNVRDPIGFAGLARLVSSIDSELLEADKRAGGKSDALAKNKDIVPQSKQSHSLNTNARGTTGSLMPLFLVLLAAGGIGFAVSSKDVRPTKSLGSANAGQEFSELVAPSVNYPAAQSDPTSTQFNWDATVSSQPVTPPPSPALPTVAANGAKAGDVVTQQLAVPNLFRETKRQRPLETRPKVAADAVLYASEIQYCLAEKIRIEGGEGVLDAYVAEDVDRFNVYVSDYDGRCGNFRYHRNAVDMARAAVEPFRDDYLAEGRRRFRKE
jgi:hypothetical protein